MCIKISVIVREKTTPIPTQNVLLYIQFNNLTSLQMFITLFITNNNIAKSRIRNKNPVVVTTIFQFFALIYDFEFQAV